MQQKAVFQIHVEMFEQSRATWETAVDCLNIVSNGSKPWPPSGHPMVAFERLQ